MKKKAKKGKATGKEKWVLVNLGGLSAEVLKFLVVKSINPNLSPLL